MKKTMAQCLLMFCAAGHAVAQGFDADPVFKVRLLPDRAPLVAGEELRLAISLTVNTGWHINSDEPGDEFSLPTTVEFLLPDGWPVPVVSFPDGKSLDFDFSDTPIEVWEDRAVILAGLVVPGTAVVVPPGSSSKPANQELFKGVVAKSPGSAGSSDLGSKSLPLLLVGVFLAGLALNLTPCVFPLIPITIGFFTQQTKDREGSAFPLALAYVMGIAVTYSVLGVLAALSGAIFGSALQSPWVVGLIVVVLLLLATSMFGLWELRVPGWAQRASGGRSGVFGALIMGLVMGFVAAPCIGPFVVGLLTYVGQRGDPFLGWTEGRSVPGVHSLFYAGPGTRLAVPDPWHLHRCGQQAAGLRHVDDRGSAGLWRHPYRHGRVLCGAADARRFRTVVDVSGAGAGRALPPGDRPHRSRAAGN
jgi:thiol:disulfide interchange protein DsbD